MKKSPSNAAVSLPQPAGPQAEKPRSTLSIRYAKPIREPSITAGPLSAAPPSDTGQIGSSDDGEPRGTAGKPILNILLHKQVGQIVVVVSRYFGGIKLGTGGLVRAYSGATQSVLEGMSFQPCVPCRTATIAIDYSHEKLLRQLCEKMKVAVKKATYTESVLLFIDVPGSIWQDFLLRTANVTRGKAKINLIDKIKS